MFPLTTAPKWTATALTSSMQLIRFIGSQVYDDVRSVALYPSLADTAFQANIPCTQRSSHESPSPSLSDLCVECFESECVCVCEEHASTRSLRVAGAGKHAYHSSESIGHTMTAREWSLSAHASGLSTLHFHQKPPHRFTQASTVRKSRGIHSSCNSNLHGDKLPFARCNGTHSTAPSPKVPGGSPFISLFESLESDECFDGDACVSVSGSVSPHESEENNGLVPEPLGIMLQRAGTPSVSESESDMPELMSADDSDHANSSPEEISIVSDASSDSEGSVFGFLSPAPPSPFSPPYTCTNPPDMSNNSPSVESEFVVCRECGGCAVKGGRVPGDAGSSSPIKLSSNGGADIKSMLSFDLSTIYGHLTYSRNFDICSACQALHIEWQGAAKYIEHAPHIPPAFGVSHSQS